MRLLITGIHGFVGTNLVAALKENHTIYGLDIVAPEKPGVEKTFSWDDLDKGLIPEVDAVIHLAGKAHDTKNQSAADVYFKVNTDLTKKIYDWYLSQPSARKFVFFSSVKAAADTVVGDILTEDVTPCPIGPYGESKIAAENYIREKWDVDDKTTIILRPCMIHGPGNKGNLNLLYSVVRHGIPWPLGAFDNRRTFTSIGNLITVIDGILSKDIPSDVYHMADDEALSTNELITIICEALGRTAHIWHIPCGLMNSVAKVGTLLHLPLNSERLRKLTENYIASNAKIKKALGLVQMPIRARDGLTTTIQSFASTTEK